MNTLDAIASPLLSDLYKSPRPTTSSSALTDADTWSTFLTMPSTPAVSDTPDDIFSSNWSTPLDLLAPSIAPIMSQTSGSPTDFAFELPLDNKTPSSGHSYTPTTGNSYGLPFSAYSSASSFSSSASGSFGGASFSSTDALPAISRDFSRPSMQQAKRPATAGGALQSRSPFGNYLESDKKDQVEDQGLFSNPFISTLTRSMQPDAIDPRYIPANRRASEGQGIMAPPSWPVQAAQALPAPPTHINPYSLYQQASTQTFRGPSSTTRPQTSDGLPSFGDPTPLPSARSLASASAFTTLPSVSTLQPPAQIRSSYDSATHNRERLDHRAGYMPSTSRSEGELTFVPIGGPMPRKRPRRRFDEIERLYKCGWNGCEKSYGTLNHLNAHVAMQKHGEKRLPSEFKDMRKAWRKKKRESTAANSNGHHASGSWARGSISSESDFERRVSTASTLAGGSDGRFPITTSANYTYDSRPTTSSSVASSSDGRSYYPQPNVPPFGYQTIPSTSVNSAPFAPPSSSLQNRRDSAPQRVALPSQPNGFRINDDGPTPTALNPFPLQMGGMGYQHQPQYIQQRPGTGGFPFQALTQPMPVAVTQQYQQFAFQR